MRRRGRSTRISLTNLMRTFLDDKGTENRALGNDLWRQNPVNRQYDYKLIHSRLQSLIEAQEIGDAQGLIYIIRSGVYPRDAVDLRTSSESRKHHRKETLQSWLRWVSCMFHLSNVEPNF
jgi:hypothetical protein